MTHEYFSRNRDKYRFIAPNIQMWAAYEMDIIGVRRSGFVDEIEIKVSRSDFLADFKKVVIARDPGGDINCKAEYENKHESLASGRTIANYFSFMMPEELAMQCVKDIPDHAGLYAYSTNPRRGAWIWPVKASPRLHKTKIPSVLEERMMRTVSWRYWKLITEGGWQE